MSGGGTSAADVQAGSPRPFGGAPIDRRARGVSGVPGARGDRYNCVKLRGPVGAIQRAVGGVSMFMRQLGNRGGPCSLNSRAHGGPAPTNLGPGSAGKSGESSPALFKIAFGDRIETLPSTTQRGILATPFAVLLRSWGRPSPLHEKGCKGSALPPGPY